MNRAIALAIVLLLATATQELLAQVPRWEVDLNASRIQFDTATALNAPSATGLLEWRRPSLFGRLSGGVTGFENAGWSTQGRGDLAAWLSPVGRSSPLRVELSGTATGARHSGGFNSLLGRLDARLHLVGDGLGAWAGTGGVVAKNSDDVGVVTGLVPGLGVWARSGPLRATASYLHERVEGRTFPEANLILLLSRDALDASLYGGFRTFPGTTAFEDVDTETWLGASVAFWFQDNAAVVVSGGQYAADILQGLPGGEFVSIGIRLTSRRERPIPRRVPTPIVYTLDRVRDQGITLEVPDAERVEIAGDFNNWTLQALERGASGAWVLPRNLEPGVYRFNLRVDGERWIVPEGVPEVEDGFGDTVGLLIISAR